jgi:hypothetical protein
MRKPKAGARHGTQREVGGQHQRRRASDRTPSGLLRLNVERVLRATSTSDNPTAELPSLVGKRKNPRRGNKWRHCLISFRRQKGILSKLDK